MKSLRHIRSSTASSLIVTLFVLVVLSTIVVAFMQSMSVERLTAKSVKNRYVAELAVDAGFNGAVNRVSTLMISNSFHSVGYTNVTSGMATNVPYPVFYGASTYTNTPQPYFLVSTLTASGTLPALDATNSINLNFKSSFSGTTGWIGSPIYRTNNAWIQTYEKNAAPWVDILLDPSKPNQPDRNAPNYNPIVSRYAYWIEDETAKLDISQIGNTNGISGLFKRSAVGATSVTNTTSRVVADLDFGALPVNNRTPLDNSAASGAINKAVFDFFNQNTKYPSDSRVLNQLSPAFVGKDIVNDVKFHATRFSLSSELAGTGKRRVNLNNIVTTSQNPNVIAADLDDIIYVVTGSHVYRNPFPHSALNNAAHNGIFLDQTNQQGPMPDFGRRFYNAPVLSTSATVLKDDHRAVYLLKLAANIRDYIDTDSQPTIIDESGQVIANTRPTLAWESGSEPIANGKEAIPYLQEHAWRGKLVNLTIVPGTNPSNRRQVNFTMDHYFEFYNPSTKPFTAPSGTFLKVYDLPTFNTGTGYSSFTLPDFEIDVSGVVFPAGVATVLTTAPSAADDPTGLIQNGLNVVRCDGTAMPALTANLRQFTVMGNFHVGSETGDDRRFGITLDGRNSAATDYETEVVFGTSLGYLDSHGHLAIAGVGTPFEMTLSANGARGTWIIPQLLRDNRRFVWAHSLRGNDASGNRSGDPRSTNEPLEYVAGSNSAFGSDQYRYFNGYQGCVSNGNVNPNPLPNTSTIGSAAISFVIPTNWPDYHITLTDTANTAYAVIADNAMLSIGELGNIYDPFRVITAGSDGGNSTPPDTTKIKRARGGGQTLKIGQPDTLVVGSRFATASSSSVGWFNGAWRLCDIFSADLPTKVASDPTAHGKININGVLRDRGTAFRAALRNFTFSQSPEGDSNRANDPLSDTEMDNLIANIIQYLSTNGPMMDRGELAQLAFFNGLGSANTAGGQPSSTTIDRGREELFRRVVEMTTTRSLSFCVHVAGQSVRQDSSGKIIPLSSVYKKIIFQLEPQIGNGPNDKVTGYKYRIVYEI